MEALKERIENRFTECIQEECPLGSTQCRGGSHLLYHLIRKNHELEPIKDFNPSNLFIISSIGHTFLVYYPCQPKIFIKSDINYTHFLSYPCQPIYIDPTISQFNPEYPGVFVGTKEDLYKVVTKESDRNDYNIIVTVNIDLMTVEPKKDLEKYARCYTTKIGGKKTRRSRSLYRKSHKNRK